MIPLMDIPMRGMESDVAEMQGDIMGWPSAQDVILRNMQMHFSEVDGSHELVLHP